LIVAPGVAKGGTVASTPVSHVDLFPTLAQLCGVKPPTNLQGQSLVPMLVDPAAVGRGWALTQVTRGNQPPRAAQATDASRGANNPRAAGTQGNRNDPGNRNDNARFFGYSLRTPKWRYTEWDESKRGSELYDHEADPKELNNLAGSPDHQAIVEGLSKELRSAVSATYPTSGIIPELIPGIWAPNLTEP
jgi:iduronate 2-sulfatase